MEFGLRIRAVRRHLKLGQIEFADLLRRSSNKSLSNLEVGRASQLPLDALGSIVRLASDHGISLSWLMLGEGPMLAGDLARNLMTLGTGRVEMQRRGAPVLGAAMADLIEQQVAAAVQRVISPAPSPAAGPAGDGSSAPPSPPPPPAPADSPAITGEALRDYRVVGMYEPGFRLVDPEGLPGDWAGQYVPVIGRLAAGDGVDTIEAEEFAPGWAASFLVYKDAPAGAFALRVVGGSMAPEYRDGDMVVVDPARPATSGICCVIYARDGGDRIARLKRLRRARKWAWLESTAPGFPAVRVPAQRVVAYQVIAHLPLLRPRP